MTVLSAVVPALSLSQMSCLHLILLPRAIRKQHPKCLVEGRDALREAGACVKWDVTQRSGSCHTLKAKLSSFALSHNL